MACPTGWNDSTSNKSIIYAFLLLQALGGIGMLIIFLTAAVNTNVKRRSTWYSFCISWIISSISYCILSLAGQQFNCSPRYALCLTQTALIYSAPTLTAATTLSLVVHMLLNFDFITSETPFDTDFIALAMLLFLPYCIWFVMLVGVLTYGIDNPESIQRLPTVPYCSSNTASWSNITFVVVGVLSIVLIGIQVLLAIKTFRNRQVFRQACGHSGATLLRIMIFTVLGALMLCTAAGFTFARRNSLGPFEIILSLFPILATIVFGSQTDILKSWKFWTWNTAPLEVRKRFSAKPYYSVPTTERHEPESWELTRLVHGRYGMLNNGANLRPTHLPGHS